MFCRKYKYDIILATEFENIYNYHMKYPIECYLYNIINSGMNLKSNTQLSVYNINLD